MQFSFGDQREENHQHLVDGRDRGMGEDARLFRVDPSCQVIRHQVQYVFGYIADVVAVGDYLVVRDQHRGVHPFVLQFDAGLQRPEIVADMQVPRGAIAGEDAVAVRASGLDVFADAIRDFLRSAQSVARDFVWGFGVFGGFFGITCFLSHRYSLP